MNKKLVLAGTAVFALVLAIAVVSPALAEHDKDYILHKPGTPAEKNLCVDDESVQDHLDHGDTFVSEDCP